MEEQGRIVVVGGAGESAEEFARRFTANSGLAGSSAWLAAWIQP